MSKYTYEIRTFVTVEGDYESDFDSDRAIDKILLDSIKQDFLKDFHIELTIVFIAPVLF